MYMCKYCIVYTVSVGGGGGGGGCTTNYLLLGTSTCMTLDRSTSILGTTSRIISCVRVRGLEGAKLIALVGVN